MTLNENDLRIILEAMSNYYSEDNATYTKVLDELCHRRSASFDLTLPDFGILAEHAMSYTENELKSELLNLFEMGRALGRREGSETEWQKIWEATYKDMSPLQNSEET